MGRARRKLSLFGRAHGSYELNALETHVEVDEADRPRAPSVEDLLRAVDADTSEADEGRPSPATTIYANQSAIVDQRKQMWQRQQSFVRDTGQRLGKTVEKVTIALSDPVLSLILGRLTERWHLRVNHCIGRQPSARCGHGLVQPWARIGGGRGQRGRG